MIPEKMRSSIGSDIPCISIITSAYNGENSLRQCIDSVRSQTFTSWEHIIIDDGSKDGSRRLAENSALEDSRLRVFIQPHRGAPHARNRGARTTNVGSQYFLFLDQEDCLKPDALQRLYNYLEASPKASAAFGGAIWQDDDVPIAIPPVRLQAIPGGVTLSQTEKLQFAHVIAACPISAPGQCLIRRDAFFRVGGFDSSLAPCDDWELYLRLTALGTIDRIGASTLDWRKLGENDIGSKQKIRDARALLFRRWMHSNNASPEQRLLARASFAYAMYGGEADACRGWALSAAADGNWRYATFNLLRAIRLELAALPVRAEAWIASTRPESEDALAAT